MSSTIAASSTHPWVNPVTLGYKPREGTREAITAYNWTGQTRYTDDLTRLQSRAGFSTIQGAIVHNGDNASSVTISIPGTGHSITCPAQSEAVFPLIMGSSAPIVTVSTQAVSATTTRICWLNYPVEASVWSAPGLAGPTLDLNFQNGSVTVPPMVFTRASAAATYFDITGTLQTVGANVPRIDYGAVPGAVPLGLLIEESRANTISNSTMLGVTNGALPAPGVLPTNWFQGATTNQVLTILGTGVENGIAYIDFSIVASGAGSSRIQFESPAPTWPGSTAYALTAYVKLLSGSFAGFSSFNLQAFSLPSAVPTSVSLTGVTTAGLATQRFTTTGVTGAADTSVRPEFFCTATGAGSVTLRIGAPQLELGAFPTSYIPTSGVAVTRAADLAVVPVGVWFQPNAAGTLLGETMQSALPGAGVAGVAELNDGTASNRWFVAYSAVVGTGRTNDIIAGVGAGVATTANAMVVGAVNKAGLSQTVTAASLALNGGAIAQVAWAPGLPPGITQLQIGSLASGNALNGWASRVRYWTRAMGAGELQSITT